MKFLEILVLSILSVSPVISQQSVARTQPQFCAAVELKQFDFWVGDWDLTWPGKQANETGHGSNTIKRILDGCVIQENFSGEAAHLRGTSVSTFDATGK